MDEQMSPPKMRRGMRWVLGISLALNLVFVGVFAGAAFRHMGKDDEKRIGRGPSLSYGAPLARSLPRNARRALLQGMRAEASGLPSRAERQQLYRQMLTALRAEPFEATAVTEIFAAQGNAAQLVQAYAQEKWLSLVEQMSPQERLEVATRLEEALKRPRRKGKAQDRDKN